jgi:hypothetical protein
MIVGVRGKARLGETVETRNLQWENTRENWCAVTLVASGVCELDFLLRCIRTNNSVFKFVLKFHFNAKSGLKPLRFGEVAVAPC